MVVGAALGDERSIAQDSALCTLCTQPAPFPISPILHQLFALNDMGVSVTELKEFKQSQVGN